MEDGVRVFCGEGGKIVKQRVFTLMVAGYQAIACIFYVRVRDVRFVRFLASIHLTVMEAFSMCPVYHQA